MKKYQKLSAAILGMLFLLSGLTTEIHAQMSPFPGPFSGTGEAPEQMRGGRGMQFGGGSGSQNMVSEPGEIITGIVANPASSLEADRDNAVIITVTEDNNSVKIDAPGTYMISGGASDGSITVKKGTKDVVLILSDLDLTSSKGAPLSVNKEAEVMIIVSGTVTLTDAEDPADEYSSVQETADAYDGAAMKLKADSAVYITGEGTLNLIGQAKNGIKGGDNASLILDGPAVRIAAVNDAVNMNYDLAILSGSAAVSAGDDGLHADHILTIGNENGTGPVITVTQCGEGLEAEVINIFGGDITINASDDAVNAAYKSGEMTPSINMTGGNVTINGQGDGFDSNGNVNLIGGSAVINTQFRGGEAGVDYDGAYYISDSFQMTNAGGVSGPDAMGGGQGEGRGGWGRP